MTKRLMVATVLIALAGPAMAQQALRNAAAVAAARQPTREIAPDPRLASAPMPRAAGAAAREAIARAKASLATLRSRRRANADFQQKLDAARRPVRARKGLDGGDADARRDGDAQRPQIRRPRPARPKKGK